MNMKEVPALRTILKDPLFIVLTGRIASYKTQVQFALAVYLRDEMKKEIVSLTPLTVTPAFGSYRILKKSELPKVKNSVILIEGDILRVLSRRQWITDNVMRVQTLIENIENLVPFNNTLITTMRDIQALQKPFSFYVNIIGGCSYKAENLVRVDLWKVRQNTLDTSYEVIPSESTSLLIPVGSLNHLQKEFETV